MKVKELIEALQKFDPEMQVLSNEVYLDCEYNDAYRALNNTLPAIDMEVMEAQSNRKPGDKCNEDYIEYDFDAWDDVIDKCNVLIIG